MTRVDFKEMEQDGPQPQCQNYRRLILGFPCWTRDRPGTRNRRDGTSSSSNAHYTSVLWTGAAIDTVLRDLLVAGSRYLSAMNNPRDFSFSNRS